ncbi:MAG: ParA family protein [Euryarchaeota archaeon]|jgi:chromosome partitioning protein|nr:ParA family protein [Euryarchaeota archaeon]MBT4802089.1 ParA family protein [Euryarchaeota archaeon]MBT6684345.1 ParA family protein [Euryarchaeota archaeon]MBT6873670.1 ParA family protein [Euryarchaeota archaeon]MBT7413703.1 ParA family protein [Euryarchaeota archaeon]
MAVVIACVNHKGGCAKTTTAVNLAVSLSTGNKKMDILSRRVLLIDLDPKGNVATTFGLDKKTIGLTMNELFKSEIEGNSLDINEFLIGPKIISKSMKDAWEKHNPNKTRGMPKNIVVNNLWLLPADLDLAGIEIDLATRLGRENRLEIAIRQIKKDFDVIIIDTPASLGLLTINALAAAEWILIPIQSEFYALEGMGQLMNSIRDVQKAVNPNLKLFGILLTMVQTRSKLCETVVEQARKYFGESVFKTQIQRSISIAESPLEGAPIVIAQKPNKTNQGSVAYWRFAKEADERIKRILNV